MKLNYINSRHLTWATVAVGGTSLAISGYKYFHSQAEDKKAAREGQQMKRPFYSVPTEDLINRNIAEGQAQQGLSSAEKQYAGEQRERGLATSGHAISETGAGVNQFGELNQVFADSLKSQSALDAQEHKQNIDFFTKANSEVAAQKGIQWGVNELQPYESKLKEIQDRRIAAKTNENNAINEGLGSMGALSTSLNSVNKTSGQPAAPASQSPYNRTFGLADTGATPGADPATGFNVLDPNAAAGVTAGPDLSGLGTAIAGF